VFCGPTDGGLLVGVEVGKLKSPAQIVCDAQRRYRRRRLARIQKLAIRRRSNQQYFSSVFGTGSKIIAMLEKHARRSDDQQSSELTLTVPEIFSIIEDPETAIAVACEFARAVRRNPVKNIFVDHSKVKTYDLAASGLLDVIAVELNYEVRRRGSRVRWRGRYPKDTHIRRFIQALGLIKHLEIPHEYPKESEAARLRVFDRRNNHYYRERRPEKADFKSKVVAGFADHINNCLSDHKLRLTPDALHKLCKYTSEIIDNAEEHGDMVDWTIQGYLDNWLETPICEIAIFNFGKSIAETLFELPRDSYTWSQISPYLAAHYSNRWFGSGWRESDLLTLIALQGHVSSKNTSESDTRGNGTVDLIEFFQKVHEACSSGSSIKPRMAIVSGSTFILFDGTYSMPSDPQAKKIIAFNSENDLAKKPDPKFVRALHGTNFPGTAISIRFPLSVVSNLTAEENSNDHVVRN
jgi:hypothetical protein